MANNIYRRQPVQHKLPTDYASIDNVKYFNINNVSGLQVYDNPLVAAQNSTYNCKNIYRDELGNLTVRPAVHYSISDTNTMLTTSYLTWYKETRLGIIYIYEYGGTGIESTQYDSVNIQPKDSSYIWQKLIPHGESISVEETEDGIYILLNVYDASSLPAKTRLEFWKINNDGSNEQVIGEIQLNNVLKPDLSLYNILNDRTYTNQTIINSDDSKNKYDIVASIISEINATPSDVVKILKYKYGIAVFYYEGDTLRVILLKESGTISNIEIGAYKKKISDWRIFDPFCIKEYPDGEYFDLTFAYLKDTDTYITEISVTFSGAVTTIADNKAINAIVTNSNGVSFTLLDSQPAYDGYYIGVAHKTTVNSSSQHYNMQMLLVKNNSVIKLFTLSNDYASIRNYPCYNIFCSDKFVMFGQIPYDYTSYSSYTCKYEAIEYKTNYKPIKSGLFGTQRKYDLAHFKQLSLPNAIFVSNLRYSSATGNFQGDKYYMPIEYYAPRENTVFDSHAILPLNTGDILVIDPLYVTSDTENIYIWRNYNESRLVNQIAAINILTSKVIHEYYKENKSSATMLVFGDWVFEIDDNLKYYKRQIQGNNIAIERPTDKIPVLSQFSEDIITSFFLDGYYWFITENHIFGTGAANGQITIEFFDPMKYFAVTEKLTAAVRVSDTSFWVFHNNGAYLIYKSTMSTENGTQYVWMCTNTAKSKGCDFKNAVITLPVTSAVAVVTVEDICSVEMKENIQSDDRTLVPMTLSFRQMIRDLLETTESIKIATYHYLTIFFLNQNKKDLTMPAVVYDSTIDSWWYWEFPFVQVFNIYQTETNVKIYAEYGAGSNRALFKLSEDSFVHTVNAIDYTVYADKLPSLTRAPYALSQINWEWESAILIFDTVDFRKQLLFTTFVFDDYNIPEDKYANHSSINFEYYFNIYSRKYANTSPQATSTTVYRVTNNACRTMVANFNYLQLILRNRKSTDDKEGYEAMNKPKICSISLKYRILRGAIT